MAGIHFFDLSLTPLAFDERIKLREQREAARPDAIEEAQAAQE